MSSRPPPIEPLSRPAWERVEAGLFARLDAGEHLAPSPTTRGPALSRRHAAWGVGALAAAACVALWWRLDASSPSQPVASPEPPTLHEARIATTDAPTQTTLGESVLVLAAHSNVNVAGSDATGWRVRLEQGQVDFAVAPRRGRPAFVVDAGATRVTVVGTRFSVAREADAARVSVTEGHVQVDSGDAHALLGPGESWPRSVAPAPAADAGAPSTEPAPAGKAAPRAQQRFDRAARLESRNPRAALAIYRELGRGKGPWAANAAYAEARLELELGHTERAERLLRRYLARYPRGVNAADVQQLLDRSAP